MGAASGRRYLLAYSSNLRDHGCDPIWDRDRDRGWDWNRGIVGLGSWDLTLQLADSFDYAGFLSSCVLFAALGFVLLT